MSKNNLPHKSLYYIVCICLLIITPIHLVQRKNNPADYPEITPKDMLSDYDYMWHIIENQWPYLTLAEQGGFFRDTPIDWRWHKSVYRKQLENPILLSEGRYAYNGQVLNPNELMIQVFKDSIAPFSKYGHLMILDRDFYYPNFSALDYSSKSRAFYESIPSHGRNSRDEETTFLYHVEGIPVIELRSFADSYSDKETTALIEKIDHFCAKNINSNHFIVDIRGNGGGNSIIWQEGLRRIFLSKDAAFKRISGIMEGSVNNYTSDDLSIVNLHIEYSELPLDIANSLIDAGLNYAVIKVFDHETIYNGRYLQQEDIPPYHGKIWLLTDQYVYSSAEMLTIFAKEAKAATVVGTTTKGDGMVIEGTPKIHELPNSGLMFMCSCELPMNNDGSYNTFSGTKPDIMINDDEDALNRVLKYIKQT